MEERLLPFEGDSMRAALPRCCIRPMRPDDIPQVLDIERQSFPSIWPQTVYQRELKNKMARALVVSEPADEPAPAEEAPDQPAGERGVGGLVHRFLGGLPAPAP